MQDCLVLVEIEKHGDRNMEIERPSVRGLFGAAPWLVRWPIPTTLFSMSASS